MIDSSLSKHVVSQQAKRIALMSPNNVLSMNNQAFEHGKISIVMTTYNRSHMIKKSIDSLLNQTYKNFEIIIVDNGSTDDTPKVLQEYEQPRFEGIIRLFRLEENRRFSGGANFGLDQIRGEWFTILDDDDIAYPKAFETMLSVLDTVDPAITAINCNCIDSSTGKLSGFGLTEDRYLSFEDTLNVCKGEFWGITKTELLGSTRFNENLLAYDSTFWFQIDKKANRYYIHQPLRLYVTDHGPTDTKFFQSKNRHLKAEIHRVLANEDFYWNSLAKHNPSKYKLGCIKGIFYLRMAEDQTGARKYFERLSEKSNLLRPIAKSLMIIPARLLRLLFSVMPMSQFTSLRKYLERVKMSQKSNL